MSGKLRVLIIEDSEDDLLLLLQVLRRSGYELEYECVDNPVAMHTALDTRPWNIIISDYSLPQFSAPQALARLKESGIDLPFLIVSGTIGEERAVAALLAGANDFISKDNLARLIPAIERELREAETRRARHAAENALRESETRYRHLFERNPVPLWVYDLESLAFLAVNDAAIQHYGYSEQEFLSMTIGDIQMADDAPHLPNEGAGANSGLSEVQSARHIKKDGTVMDVEVTAHDILFGDKNARLVLANDVTERNRAMETVKRSNQRLTTLHSIDKHILTAQSPETICQFALEFIASLTPLTAASITNFDLEAGQGRVLTSYRRQQTGSEVTSFSLEPFADDIEWLKQDKTESVEDLLEAERPTVGLQSLGENIRSYVTIPLIAQDKLIGALNLGSDKPRAFTPEQIEISMEIADQIAIAIQQARYIQQIQEHNAELEKRVAQRTTELQDTTDRIRAILNNSSDAMLVASYDGVIQQINPTLNELFDYSLDEVIGESVLSLVSPDDVERVLDVLSTVINTGKTRRIEVISCRKDGSQFYADIGLAVILHEAKIRGIVCSIRDITERKQIEQELRLALDKEKELNDLKSRFTSMISHEFRTPLTVILSSSGLLQNFGEKMTEEKRAAHLHQIQAQVGHLTGLLDDVLTLSRSDVVALEVHAERLDLEAFCKRMVEDIQQTTQKHEIIFSVSGQPQHVYLDGKLMRQILSNLLSNAVKYSPEGGIVNTDLLYEDNCVSIRVKDEGIGIPEADQKRLFEIFHRAKNVGAISGTGLGLPIVKRAVEAHGGSVEVESQVDVGTTVTIRIPTQMMIGADR